MNELVRTAPAAIDAASSFNLKAWLTSLGRFNPTDIICGPGAGKSRFIGRVLAYHDFIQGTPQIVIDPTGVSSQNIVDKVNRIAPDFEQRWWQQYHQPLPPEWVRYIEVQLEQLTERIQYVDMNGQGGFPLYYRLAHDESLFDMAQRFIEVIRRLDPALETASVEGMNAAYKLGTYVGMVLSALGLQITEAEDLIRHPEQWQGRFDQALAAYPEVYPAVVFFRDFISHKELRNRRSDSFLTKILAFTADPKMAIMFGTSQRSVNGETVVNKKQTVLLDFSKVDNQEHRRFLMLWANSEVISYTKWRGTAGRTAPLGYIIDEISQLLGYQQHGQAVMAADLEELVSVLSRNYGLMLTIAHQSLTQLDKRMQNALLQGNLLIGAVRNPDDAEQIARYLFRYNPDWVRKEEAVYFGEPDPRIIDTSYSYSYSGLSIQERARIVPKVIDYRTVEYTAADQLLLFSQAIQALPRFTFLVHASGVEGQPAQHVQKLDISAIDPGIYPDQENVTEACRRLSLRSGFSKEKVFAEIAQRTRKPSHKKPVKAPTKPATLEGIHDPQPTQPTQSISHSGTPSDDSTRSTSRTSGSTNRDFWEAKTETINAD